jgi:hypothetical protein
MFTKDINFISWIAEHATRAHNLGSRILHGQKLLVYITMNDLNNNKTLLGIRYKLTLFGPIMVPVQDRMKRSSPSSIP